MILRNKEVLLKAQNDSNYMDKLLGTEEAEKFIKYVIKSFTKNPARFMQQHQVEWEDLYQACLLGLFNGIKRLDMEKTPNEWVRFLYLSIQGEIRNFSRSNNSNSLSISQRVRSMYPKYIKFYQKHREELDKDPSIEETMNELKISRDDAFDLVYGMQQLVSIFLEISGSNHELTIGDLINDPYANVENMAINRVLVGTYMSYLTNKQQQILYMHYYLGLNKTEIAKIIGCANSMIQKYIENAFKQIRSLKG